MIMMKKLSKMTATVLFMVLSSIATTPVANAVTTYLEPSSYNSFDDSPFKGGNYSYFNLEDFEDGFLNTPGVNASSGVINLPSPFNISTDSVDSDDRVIDGSGLNGYSWYSADKSTIRFTFNASVLGALPTNVGIVWTDVGFSDTGLGFGQVNLEAFDVLGTSLGVLGSIVGDGDFRGQTAEDRFFGAINLDGISAIEIRMLDSTDWEVDHLQYGRANSQSVPEPSSLLGLFAVGAMGIGLRLQCQQNKGLATGRRSPLR
ncbi:PEP-CTERM sorting domain-containing protein [Komarekiella sp. 'clone 1']|uniref:PEP-CTERM sorting domain-containing protein n=2 Tax=Komarekiella TaxID=2022127 RepID=A0AA40SYW1_9NOST|nr:PEP-CTERM sorting domain-containing protein [Komarekiella delphini-convector SJRDD-AB1]